MVVVLDDPPAAETQGQAPPRKRGGGVRTERGKRVSRANSLKNSLRSKVVFTPEMAAAIVARTKEFTDQFQPRSPFERMLISDMAVAKAKLDHAQILTVKDIDRTIERALHFWDDDQKTRALKLAARLERDPVQTAHALRGSKQGVLVLLEMWRELAQAAESGHDWDEAQHRLACDLLAIRLELRPTTRRIPPAGDATGRAKLAREQVEQLVALKEEVLDRADSVNRVMAIEGLPVCEDATTKQLRRLEVGFRNAYNRAYDILMKLRADAAANPSGSTGTLFSGPPGGRSLVDYDNTLSRWQRLIEIEDSNRS